MSDPLKAMRRRAEPGPVARTADLVVEEIDDEVVVYDKASRRAHALSPVAARVWRACDGRRPGEIAASLGLDEVVVARAAAELDRCGLLDGAASAGLAAGGGLTRRDLGAGAARIGAAAAVSSPFIYSIAAPAPSAAQSLLATCANPNGQPPPAGCPNGNNGGGVCQQETDPAACALCLSASGQPTPGFACELSTAPVIGIPTEIETVNAYPGTTAPSPSLAPHWIAVAPDESFMVTADYATNEVSLFKLTDGLPSVVALYQTESRNATWGVAITPDSACVVATNRVDTVTPTAGSITSFAVQSGPALSLTNNEVLPGYGASGLAFSPDGMWLAVGLFGSNAIVVYQYVTSDSSCSPVPQNSVVVSATPPASENAPFPGFPAPYTPPTSKTVSSVAWSPDGGTLLSTNARDNSVTTFIFTVDPSTGLPVLTLHEAYALSELGSIASGTGGEAAGAWDVAVSPDGKFVVVADAGAGYSAAVSAAAGNANKIYLYSLNQSTHELTPITAVDVGNNPLLSGVTTNSGAKNINSRPIGVTIAETPCGLLMACANIGDGTVSVFSVNSVTGAATMLGPEIQLLPSGTDAKHVAFSQDGRYLYTSNYSSTQTNAATGGNPSPTGNTVSVITIGCTSTPATFCVTDCGSCVPSLLAPSCCVVDLNTFVSCA